MTYTADDNANHQSADALSSRGVTKSDDVIPQGSKVDNLKLTHTADNNANRQSADTSSSREVIKFVDETPQGTEADDGAAATAADVHTLHQAIEVVHPEISNVAQEQVSASGARCRLRIGTKRPALPHEGDMRQCKRHRPG